MTNFIRSQIMQRKFGPLLFLTVSSFAFCSYVTQKDEHYFNYLLQREAADLFHTKHFSLTKAKAAYSYDGIEKVYLSFSCFRTLGVKEARRLLIETVNELLEVINNDPFLIEKRMLRGGHFCAKDLYLEITSENIFAQDCDNSGAIKRTVLKDSKITYTTYDSSSFYDYGVKEFHETYSDAMLLNEKEKGTSASAEIVEALKNKLNVVRAAKEKLRRDLARRAAPPEKHDLEYFSVLIGGKKRFEPSTTIFQTLSSIAPVEPPAPPPAPKATEIFEFVPNKLGEIPAQVPTTLPPAVEPVEATSKESAEQILPPIEAPQIELPKEQPAPQELAPTEPVIQEPVMQEPVAEPTVPAAESPAEEIPPAELLPEAQPEQTAPEQAVPEQVESAPEAIPEEAPVEKAVMPEVAPEGEQPETEQPKEEILHQEEQLKQEEIKQEEIKQEELKQEEQLKQEELKQELPVETPAEVIAPEIAPAVEPAPEVQSTPNEVVAPEVPETETAVEEAPVVEPAKKKGFFKRIASFFSKTPKEAPVETPVEVPQEQPVEQAAPEKIVEPEAPVAEPAKKKKGFFKRITSFFSKDTEAKPVETPVEAPQELPVKQTAPVEQAAPSKVVEPEAPIAEPVKKKKGFFKRITSFFSKDTEAKPVEAPVEAPEEMHALEAEPAAPEETVAPEALPVEQPAPVQPEPVPPAPVPPAPAIEETPDEAEIEHQHLQQMEDRVERLFPTK